MAKTMPPLAVESSLVRTMPGQPDRLVERLRLGQAVLAGRRVEHEDRLGLGAGQALVDDPADLRQLVHEVRLGVEPAGGVGDDEVRAAGDGRIERVVDDGARVRARGVGDHRHLGPVRPDPELVDGGGAERVGGGEDDRATFGGVATRELADGRGLAGPVDADDEDHRRAAGDRRARAPGEVARDEQRGELEPDRRLRTGRVVAPAGALDEVDGEGRPDVAGDERLLDLVPRRSFAGARPEEPAEAAP